MQPSFTYPFLCRYDPLLGVSHLFPVERAAHAEKLEADGWLSYRTAQLKYGVVLMTFLAKLLSGIETLEDCFVLLFPGDESKFTELIHAILFVDVGRFKTRSITVKEYLKNVGIHHTKNKEAGQVQRQHDLAETS